MTTQPTALRLADACDTLTNLGMLVPGLDTVECAAEIRRLHAQRDALLHALTGMAQIIDKMGDMPDGFIHPSPWRELKCEEALTQARAVIKAVEENT